MRGLIDALPRALVCLPSTDSVGIASVFPGYKILLDPTVVRRAIPPALEQLRIDQQAYLKALDAPDKESRPRFDFNDLSRALVDLSKSKSVKNQQLVIVIVTDDFDLLDPKTSAGAARILVKNATLVAAFVDIENVGISIATRNVHVMRMVTPMRLGVRDRGASYFAGQTGGPVVHVRNRNYLARWRLFSAVFRMPTLSDSLPGNRNSTANTISWMSP